MPSIEAAEALEEQLSNTCRNARILVVEDDPGHRSFLSKTLENAGYRHIEHADNGHEGALKTLQSHPDLVILDLMMPVCNGIEYCERIRQHEAFRDMPILMQAGTGNLDMHRKCFEVGATDLLTKPMNTHELLTRIRTHLERSRLARRLREVRQHHESTLELAHAMKHGLSPGAHIVASCEQRYHLRIFCPPTEQSTYIWGLVALNERQLLIYQSNFSRHSVASGFHALHLRTLTQRLTHEHSDPLQLIDKILHSATERGICSLFAGVLDTRAHTLTYACTGANEPLLLQDPASMQPPLSLTSASPRACPFRTGESLLLPYDGEPAEEASALSRLRHLFPSASAQEGMGWEFPHNSIVITRE